MIDFEIITLGRSSVDLYGEQTGGRLEDMASFAKYIGGSPTNTAIGSARLGLRAGLITKVGDDHFGRFIREQLVREGVDVTGVSTDYERLTALAVLGIRDPETFPLVFFRDDCADMAISIDDIDPSLMSRTGALLVNGTHLSRPGVAAASLCAAALVKDRGGKVVFDIDYRPVLWGLAGKANGENRYVPSEAVTGELRRMLPLCDLVVGTEEEVHILGGCAETMAALREIRSMTAATIVLKRGADGCIAFPGAIPATPENGIVGKGFPIEVFNVLGAGDAFMAGFLRGWLRGKDLATSCTWGNACGALVVSRHGCAPAEPSWAELELFLSRTDWPHRIRDSSDLEQIHWSTNRASQYDSLTVLAIDHRSQFDDLVIEAGLDDASDIPAFKALALEALTQVAGDRPGFGMLADGTYGARVLETVADRPLWIGRPIEVPGSRPIRFEGSADVGVTLRDWPVDHVVKCLVFYHPDDPPSLRAAQDQQLLRLFAATRATRHELLLEVIASKHGEMVADTIARAIEHFYAIGIFPDWWKLEPMADPAAWTAAAEAIDRNDAMCRGIVLLGLSAPVEDLLANFEIAAAIPMVKGFAVGRTIWQDAALRWLKREISDAEAIAMMADRFRTLVLGWAASRARATETV